MSGRCNSTQIMHSDASCKRWLLTYDSPPRIRGNTSNGGSGSIQNLEGKREREGGKKIVFCESSCFKNFKEIFFIFLISVWPENSSHVSRYKKGMNLSV